LGPGQAVLDGERLDVRPERGEVIGEDERLAVVRIDLAVRPAVPRTEVARWVEGHDLPCPTGPFASTLPRPARPLRGDEHPLVEERVVAPMRLAGEEVERLGGCGRWRRRWASSIAGRQCDASTATIASGAGRACQSSCGSSFAASS